MTFSIGKLSNNPPSQKISSPMIIGSKTNGIAIEALIAFSIGISGVVSTLNSSNLYFVRLVTPICNFILYFSCICKNVIFSSPVFSLIYFFINKFNFLPVSKPFVVVKFKIESTLIVKYSLKIIDLTIVSSC